MFTEKTPGMTREHTRLLFVLAMMLSGCHTIPIAGKIQADANVNAGIQGTLDVKMPTAPDPGPMVPVVVRGGIAGPDSPRIALVDVDGVLVNQNRTGLYSVGENPVSAFREKLEAAA
ncbi:S49 family peptidase, partial [Singulisphaera rosea]